MRMKSLHMLILLLATGTGVANAAAQELALNGDFNSDASGWSLIDHFAANWYSGAGDNTNLTGGWDGNPGWFFVNDDSGATPETSQLIGGLTPSATYVISGYFARDTANHPDGSFRILLDDLVYLQAGGVPGIWTPFSFEYVANDSDALLRFQSQFAGDDAYGIDHISVVPAPTPVALIGLGALTVLRRRRAP